MNKGSTSFYPEVNAIVCLMEAGKEDIFLQPHLYKLSLFLYIISSSTSTGSPPQEWVSCHGYCPSEGLEGKQEWEEGEGYSQCWGKSLDVREGPCLIPPHHLHLGQGRSNSQPGLP